MSIDLLDTPLRATWDLHGTGGTLAVPQLLEIGKRLQEAGLFFVTLDERPLAHPGIGELLHLLGEGGCRVHVVCAGTPEEYEALTEGLPLAGLWLDVAPYLTDEPAWESLAQALSRLRRRHHQPSLWLCPTPRNLPLLRALLAFCREQGVGKFKLPNTKINVNAGAQCRSALPGPPDLAALRRSLGNGAAAARQGVELEIHDLFLWELFFAGDSVEGRGEYGGCQAGNSLAHVDAKGNLYPCSSWPESLGSLLDASVEQLWNSQRRQALRREIATVPSGCLGCREYHLCFGGCRGLSRYLGGAGDGRDLLCPEPRR